MMYFPSMCREENLGCYNIIILIHPAEITKTRIIKTPVNIDGLE